MTTSFNTSVRTLLLVAALAFAAQAADARSTSADPVPTAPARSTARTKGEAAPADRDGIAVDGVLIIVGIVGVVIVLAWVCSRVGDSR
ncbi:MAG: hypothetical protein J0I06_25665 [Planctomycetes bacterium]|nr:hypothetical protein [Planctomycetota bacterium]